MQQEPSSAPTIVRATGHAGNAPGQGPFMRITLGITQGVIRESSYETYQCPGCVACGHAIVAMTTGKSPKEAGAIRHDDVVRHVGPLPRHRQICYGLAVLALSEALNKLGFGEGTTWRR